MGQLFGRAVSKRGIGPNVWSAAGKIEKAKRAIIARPIDPRIGIVKGGWQFQFLFLRAGFRGNDRRNETSRLPNRGEGDVFAIERSDQDKESRTFCELNRRASREVQSKRRHRTLRVIKRQVKDGLSAGCTRGRGFTGAICDPCGTAGLQVELP